MAGNRHDSRQGADPRQGWPAPGGQPEYFPAARSGPPGAPQGDLYGADTYGAGDRYAADPYVADPYAGDQPGHTRAFTVPDGQFGGQFGGQDFPGQEYPAQDYQGPDNVAVYRAGGQSAPHVGGPRLPWRELLVGIYRAPNRTFDRMRDHQCWLPALCVSLLYGVLAVLAMGSTHNQVVNSTLSTAAVAIGGTAVAFTIAGAMLGAVTYALARQFGGDGPWQSTVGLAVLISWTTDAPRLLFALFLPSGSTLVQVLGWATWLLCAGLLTTMVRRVHDLPWGKAAGAAAVQLLALLVLIKLPTLG